MDSSSIRTKRSPRRHLSFEESDEESSPIENGQSYPIEDDVNLIHQNLKDLDSIHSRMPENLIPKLGTEFESDEDALEFYLRYAKLVSFGIRKQRSHLDKNKKLSDRTFVCACEGRRKEDKRRDNVKDPRPESRFGCLAKMKVNVLGNGKFYVSAFVAEHNHYLASPDKAHMIRSHRKITSTQIDDIEMSNSVGIAPKAAHDLMSMQAGGLDALGFTHVDYKNYLRSKRQKVAEKGDTGGVLEYLQNKQFEDPNFFYAIQVDTANMITNIFWCDAKMKADFVHFGDVVCFDTTYGKNNEGRPIALFVGVNHHKQSVVLGAALLYDETIDSFEWLFDTFSVAMSGSKPKTILTDQDAAMASALASKWPETNHRLCIWHIYQNAAIHLGHVFSEFKKEFTDDFQKCIYDFEEEEDFIREWNSMLDKYDLNDNAWLKRLFEIRKKWSLVYGRQVFCGDMTTTQRSESMNMLLKRYVSYKNKFLEFFNRFERLIEGRRYDEMVAEFKANTTVPSLTFPWELNKHAAFVYTPEVHSLFESELCKSVDTSCEQCEGNGEIMQYKVTSSRKRYHHTVTHDVGNDTFDCSCKKFQFAGILCSHILKIFSNKGVIRIPDRYILKRWTRKAKTGHIGHDDIVVDSSGLDPKVLYRLRYKDLCHLNVQLATRAAETENTYMTARNRILETLDLVDAGLQSWGKSAKTSDSHITPSTTEVVQVYSETGNKIKGIRTKQKPRSNKRLKGALEESFQKKKSCKQNVKKKNSNDDGVLMSQQCTETIPVHGSLGVVNCPDVQHSSLHVAASNMSNPLYFKSIVASQSSQHVAASNTSNPLYFQSLVASQSSQVHGVSNFGTYNVIGVREQRWKPPEAGFLKVNFGASAFQDTGGVGVVIRDEKGAFVAAMASKIPLYATSDEFEAEALRMSVKWLLELRLNRIIIEGDAFNVMMQLASARDSQAGYAIMVDQARNFLSRIREWKSSWISRTTNMVAHTLARNMRGVSDDIAYYYSPRM